MKEKNKKENFSEENSKKQEKKDNKENKNKDKSQEKIEELEKQLEEKNNDYLRTLADFENYRKRTIKEMSQARDKAIISFVENLLPAIDNFEMSLNMTQNTPMFIKGVEMIHKNLIDTLKEHKIEEFEPKIGETFDPYKHEPILIEDNSKKPGEIVKILRKGYLHKEIIVRPAKVEVVKENQEEEEKEN